MEPKPDETASDEVQDQPWYQRPRNLVGLGVLAAALVAAVILALVAINRPATDSSSGAPTTSAAQSGAGIVGATPPNYLIGSQITETQVRPGDPGAPIVTLSLPPEWSDAGVETPDWAYGAAVYGEPSNLDDPPTVLVLLRR